MRLPPEVKRLAAKAAWAAVDAALGVVTEATAQKWQVVKSTVDNLLGQLGQQPSRRAKKR